MFLGEKPLWPVDDAERVWEQLDAAGEPDGDGEEVEAGRLQQDQLRTCSRDNRLLEQGGTITISFELSSPYFTEI